jgi:hypothetical protein
MIRRLLILLCLTPMYATCHGNHPCKACSNCSMCKYCHGDGGYCGVCSKPVPE